MTAMSHAAVTPPTARRRPPTGRDIVTAVTSQLPHTPHLFFRTGPMPCPYVEGRVERNLFAQLKGADAQELHNDLALAGFRRSHHIVYRPACPGCNACVPVRIVVPGFSAGKSLRRIARRNADLTATTLPPRATDEQFHLFTAYQRARHDGGEMAAMTFADYRAMVEDTHVATALIEYRDAGALTGAMIVDRLPDGLSAVYSFFDPATTDRSLGTFMILDLVRLAAAEGRRHVYLGYWIAQCAKMAYKTRFQPIEALGPQGWQPLGPA